MKIILVCGPWSSGTTAVCGMLNALGLDGFGPYFQTNDPRTTNTFESIRFRRVIESFATEQPPRRTEKSADIISRLRAFKGELEASRTEESRTPNTHCFLKYPLSALVLPEIATVFTVKLIYVIRPMSAIEATRVRRRWAEVHGSAGAQVIYSSMFQYLIEHASPTLIVRYPELVKTPIAHARRLAKFCGLKDLQQDRIEASAAAIRQSSHINK